MKLKQKYSLILLILFWICFIIYTWNNSNRPIEFIQVTVGNLNTTSFTTIITVFYDMKSNTPSFNQDLSINFLLSLSLPLVFYTDNITYNRIIPIVRELNLSVTFYLSESLWDGLRLAEGYYKKPYIKSYYRARYKLDPDKRDPGIYALSNSKVFLVEQAVKNNLYNSSFFIYTDINGWQNQLFKTWPNESFVKLLHDFLQDRIMFNQIEHDSKDYIGGEFFAGSKAAIRLLSQKYYKVHNRYIDEKLFIGKDLTVLYELVFNSLRTKDMRRLMTWKVNCSEPINPWVFYQNYFANDDDFPCSNDRLSLLL